MHRTWGWVEVRDSSGVLVYRRQAWMDERTELVKAEGRRSVSITYITPDGAVIAAHPVGCPAPCEGGRCSCVLDAGGRPLVEVPAGDGVVSRWCGTVEEKCARDPWIADAFESGNRQAVVYRILRRVELERGL